MSYYKNQIQQITPETATIQLKDDKGNSTKTLSLNEESAKDLINWLTANYLNKGV
jgi:hypothetical protein